MNCAVIFLAHSLSVFAQDVTPDLKDKRITLQLDNQPLGVVFNT